MSNMLETMKNSANTITSKVNMGGLQLRRISPSVMIGAGVVGVVGATVLACRATLKIESIIDRTQEDLETITTATAEDLSKEEDGPKIARIMMESKRIKSKIYIKAAVDILRLYAPAIAIGGVSIGLIVGSHKMMTRRNAALAAAYKALDKAYHSYQERVVDALGEERERDIRYDISEETGKVTDEETGETKTAKVKVMDGKGYSPYARFFDESSTQWVKTPEYNAMFLNAQQKIANDMLQARGHVFLNEVYDMLGLPRSSAGSVVGWVADSEGDNFIDFGIYDGTRQVVRDFVNGYERSILLDFNVDGVIYDLI